MSLTKLKLEFIFAATTDLKEAINYFKEQSNKVHLTRKKMTWRRVRLAEGAPQTLQPSIALANVVLSIDHSAIATWDLQHYKWFKGEEEGASKTLCSWFKEAATKYCVGQCQNIVLKQFEETSAKKWFERTQENTCKDLLPLGEWHR